jgi:hypothetical protein
MSSIVGQDRSILWFQSGGPGTQWKPFGIGEKAGSVTGKSIPGPGRSPVYGRTEFGKPIVIKMNTEAPGDLPSATVQLYERAQVDILLKALQRGCPINIQVRITKCGSLINPNAWDAIDHFGGGGVTSYNPGDGPSTEYSGEIINVEGNVSFTHYIRLVASALSRLTTAEAESLLAIAGIPDEDCGECGNGYPGADQILYVGAGAGEGAKANVLVSVNGGSSWAATSANPFANDEDIDFIAVRFLNPTQLRVIVGTGTTNAGAKAKIAWATVNLGGEVTTVWTSVTLSGTTNGDIIQALNWITFDRLYIASAGDIYISQDQGESVPATAKYTGSTVINGFAKSPDDSEVFAFGASNLLLRELNEGTFEARVGPAGGGAFTAVTVASDGTMYAGNGTKIFKSTDRGASVGNWTQLKDFGSNKPVKAIQCIGEGQIVGGDSQLLRVVVDNTSGAGEVWQSVDGGATFVQVTALANSGYNAAYFSRIDNNSNNVIVGDANGGTGLIHRLAEVV